MFHRFAYIISLDYSYLTDKESGIYKALVTLQSPRLDLTGLIWKALFILVGLAQGSGAWVEVGWSRWAYPGGSTLFHVSLLLLLGPMSQSAHGHLMMIEKKCKETSRNMQGLLGPMLVSGTATILKVTWLNLKSGSKEIYPDPLVGGISMLRNKRGEFGDQIHSCKFFIYYMTEREIWTKACALNHYPTMTFLKFSTKFCCIILLWENILIDATEWCAHWNLLNLFMGLWFFFFFHKWKNEGHVFLYSIGNWDGL